MVLLSGHDTKFISSIVWVTNSKDCDIGYGVVLMIQCVYDNCII